ncbi:MAG: Flp pilus assembly complex ATPase component TadA [Rhodanobacteraceae bacterium]|nr:Flp pilus assembly complex ATPase component TadA [Rhodanobacteraceae bacterium]
MIRLALSSQFGKSEDEAMVQRLGLDPRLGSAEMHQKGGGTAVGRAAGGQGGRRPDRRRSPAARIGHPPAAGLETFEMLYRIDGDLMPVRRFLRILLPAFVSHIKVIGGGEPRRAPRALGWTRSVTSGNMEVVLRISVIPTINCEAVVIRILNTAFSQRSVAEIGFGPRDEQLFRDILSRGPGMLLVTGPTSSGQVDHALCGGARMP